MGDKSLKKNAFYSFLRVFIGLLFPLVTFPYASRILLPEGIGKVNFANSIISYFILLGNLGISGYATREASKIKNDKIKLTKFFKEIITINIISCFAAYLLFFISLFLVPKFHNYQSLLLVCSIKILFSGLGLEWIFSANEDFKSITLRSFFIQVFSLLYLFIFVKTKEDILHYAIFGLLTSLGSNILNFLFINKYVSFRLKVNLELKRHLKPIFLFLGITIVTSIYTMLDTTMLGFLSDDTEVGYYTVSTKLSHIVLTLLTSITSVLLPRLTNLVEKKDSNTFIELINKTANVLILISLPITFGLIILSKPIIILLSGEYYLPALSSMIVISPIIIFISFGSLTGVQILPSVGKEKISFYSYIIGAIINLSLNTLLIPSLGSLGAAIGTISAEFSVTITQIIYLRKTILNKSFFVNFTQSLFGCIIMTATLFFLKIIISNIVLQLVFCTIGGIIVYSISLIIQKNYCFLFYYKKTISKLSKKNEN